MDEDLRNLFDEDKDKDIDKLIDLLKKAKESGAEVEIKTSKNPIEMIKEIMNAAMPESAQKTEEHFRDQCREFVKISVTKENMDRFTKHLQGMEANEKMKACVYSFIMTFLEGQLSKGRIILKSEEKK